VITNNRIEVWFAISRPLTSADFLYLTPDERNRAARFRFDDDDIMKGGSV
jgi:hypothetical protein